MWQNIDFEHLLSLQIDQIDNLFYYDSLKIMIIVKIKISRNIINNNTMQWWVHVKCLMILVMIHSYGTQTNNPMSLILPGYIVQRGDITDKLLPSILTLSGLHTLRHYSDECCHNNIQGVPILMCWYYRVIHSHTVWPE